MARVAWGSVATTGGAKDRVAGPAKKDVASGEVS